MKIATIFLLLFLSSPSAFASQRYTEKQLDAFATRVGKLYWIASLDDRTPSFLSAPDPNARAFHGGINDSFEITNLIGRNSDHPYYKVKFASGKEGYILPESFLDQLNSTILTVDPQADEKKRAAETAAEDKKRIEWIRAQPWSEAVKDAAIKHRPVPGMKTSEVKKVLGSPSRTAKVQAPQRGFAEEHWFYPNGSVLIFQNGLLTRVEEKNNK